MPTYGALQFIEEPARTHAAIIHSSGAKTAAGIAPTSPSISPCVVAMALSSSYVGKTSMGLGALVSGPSSKRAPASSRCSASLSKLPTR
eukprot:3691751-Prymnesium_polylepis.2